MIPDRLRALAEAAPCDFILGRIGEDVDFCDTGETPELVGKFLDVMRSADKIYSDALRSTLIVYHNTLQPAGQKSKPDRDLEKSILLRLIKKE